MSVLVTGAAGFIGSHLCRRLLESEKLVIGVDDLSCGFMENIKDLVDNPKFHFIKKDIRELTVDDVATITSEVGDIIHLAARGELYFCRDNPQDAIDINVYGTVRMLQLADHLETQHFLFADTSAEYDNLTDDKCFPTPEYMAPRTTPVKHQDVSPIGTYAITKSAASQFVRSWSIQKNKKATLFRPFNVYGPSLNIHRDIPPVIGGFANRLLNGEKCVIYGDGSKSRDFIYVSDMVALIVRAFYHNGIYHDKPSRDEFYSYNHITVNAGTGKRYSIRDIYDLVHRAVFPDQLVEPPEFVPDQPAEAQTTLANIDLTKRIFQWEPEVDIRNGIKMTVESFRK